jgi:hypothetical protein
MSNDINKRLPIPLSSEEYEELLLSEYKNNEAIRLVHRPLSTRKLIVPTFNSNAGSSPKRIISMTDTTNPSKETLYKLIVAAYNFSFNNKSAAITAKSMFSYNADLFVAWLNSAEVTNRYSLLKDYEAYRFDLLNNHGGASALASIKTIFTYALDYSTELTAALNKAEINYLEELRKTPISPNLNKSQRSLATYFGDKDWLRSEDIGVGNQLYLALASPKLVIKSLITTASTLIENLYDYKKELRSFFLEIKMDPQRFVLPNRGNSVKQRYKGTIIYEIITAYHSTANKSETLKSAIKCILLSNTRNERVLNNILLALNSQYECDTILLNKVSPRNLVNADFCKVTFSSGPLCHLFSFDVLKDISNKESTIPATSIDETMFQWLMASLTVQPCDIPKLKHNSFRLLKVGGKVKHIECKYIKGRAKVFHTTRSVSALSIEGKALLTYLKMKSSREYLTPNSMSHKIAITFKSLTGLLNKLIEFEGINKKLKSEHKKQGDIPFLIPKVIQALINNEVHAYNLRSSYVKGLTTESKSKSVSQGQRYINPNFLRLSTIKNSAVHAFSDPYTLEYLVNKNSHTNVTEKENYLTDENMEWINSSGRITRDVMLDLTNNVFNLKLNDLDSIEKQQVVERFNSEFMLVTEDISNRTSEMNARFKLVTGNMAGKVNEVGVLALNESNDISEGFSIYVLDSPVTAWKMYNYLYEFKKNYKKLLAQNSEYLYKTVLPTVEWIEHSLNKLNKVNVKKGKEIHENALKNDVVISVFHSI